MKARWVTEWLRQSPRRRTLLASLLQPLTAVQVARRTSWSLDACRHAFGDLNEHALLRCMNTDARRFRLYWLTEEGVSCQRQVRRRLCLAAASLHFPAVNWALYGDMCFSHRAAIIKALSEPLQPAAVKRRAKQRDPSLRMSAGNAREAIKVMRQRGVVKSVQFDGERWSRFELTPVGRKIRTLLCGAESFRLESIPDHFQPEDSKAPREGAADDG
jgi:hypothetical protein